MDSMMKINESDIPYKFDNISGPKYLLNGPLSDFGLLIVLPGQSLPTHYHDHVEENFYVLEGAIEIHINDTVLNLIPGDLAHLPPKHPHYLVNKGETACKMIFIKSPHDENDKIEINWKPGDPILNL